MLKIANLHAEIDGKEILKGLSLTVNAGEVHAIMRPNGAGKLTLEVGRNGGLMATQLYESDFYGWTQDQAAKLRKLMAERANLDLDLENLAEEIDEVGKNRKNEVGSRLETIIEHILKLAFSPAWEPINQWKRTLRVHRRDLLAVLEDSPSLWRYAEEELADAYRHAAGQTRLSHIDLTLAAIPNECPFLLREELLNPDWLPEPLVRPA